MSSSDWELGTILKRRGERVMFVSWDHERRRMTGGGNSWFQGCRLGPADGRPLEPFKKVGALGNYSASGFREVKGGR